MASYSYINKINSVPIVLYPMNLMVNGFFAGTKAFGAQNMTASRAVDSQGAFSSSSYSYGMDFVPLVEDLYIMSNGSHRVSYAIINGDGTVGTVGYDCGDFVLSKDSGAMVRFSETLASSSSDFNNLPVYERDAIHFCMDKGGREQVIQSFENASGMLNWVSGGINVNGAEYSSSSSIRSNEIPLDTLVGVATLDGRPLRINAKTDDASLYTVTFGGFTAVTKADILKIWPTATKIRVVYSGSGSTTTVSDASNVYVGVRS